jgi:CubicO group peptidase (beta-lactamase class C family)
MAGFNRRTFMKSAAASAVLAAPVAAVPQTGPTQPPKKDKVMSRGFSKTGLGRMHEVMSGYVERGEIPGMVTLVSRRGEIHVDVLGAKSANGNDPIRRDTIFRIASLSKPVTAVAAMILVEECTLRLDEPVDRLLPELANRKVLKRLDGLLDDTVPASRPVTVRDLLTFRWGFGLVFGPPDAFPIVNAATEAKIGMGPPMPATTPAPDEWMRRLGSLPLMYQPGERWLYNTGADVMGVLVSRAAGQPFETFLRERIFDPLGMEDTSFSVPAGKLDRLPTSYWTNYATGKVEVYDKPAGGQWSRPPAFPSGAGGMVSTADDYLAFGQMLLNKGKHRNQRILSRPSVEVMITDQLTPEQKAVSGLVAGYFDNHGWGFGMSVVTKRTDMARSVGTYGWDGGFGTSWYADPKEDLTAVLMTQQAWTSPDPPNVCRDFWTSVYAAVED